MVLPGWKDRPVMFESFHYRSDVLFCTRKLDLVNKSAAIRSRRSLIPFENVAPSGVVIRQCVRNRIVGPAVACQELAQVPGPGHGILARIKELLVREQADLLRRSPLFRGGLSDLHEADLP